MSERFGTKLEGKEYTERVGAYAVAFDEQGRVALVEAPVFRTGNLWLFLPGGGIEPGESDEACIVRECLEETGCSVQVGEFLGVADEYLETQEYMHLTGHFYEVAWGEKVQEPIETDHTFMWVSVEECYERMFCKYQVWAVRRAWERRHK